MKAVKHPGICKLCGEFKELTEEHVPPQKAFNSFKVVISSFEEVLEATTCDNDRMPWDVTNIKGQTQQGGYRKYCLCRECNNNTGSWYGRAYSDFAKTIHSMIQTNSLSVGNLYRFIIKNVYPLRIYKAMMTMMCDINNDCFGDTQLRQYLLNKEELRIDLSKYSLYMYMVSTQMPRISSLEAIADLNNLSQPIFASEMSFYPIGFALYINKPKDYTPFGLNIDIFASYDYDTKCDFEFIGLPYLDINSQFPIDYRSKDDIIKCIKKS